MVYGFWKNKKVADYRGMRVFKKLIWIARKTNEQILVKILNSKNTRLFARLAIQDEFLDFILKGKVLINTTREMPKTSLLQSIVSHSRIQRTNKKITGYRPRHIMWHQ